MSILGHFWRCLFCQNWLNENFPEKFGSVTLDSEIHTKYQKMSQFSGNCVTRVDGQTQIHTHFGYKNLWTRARSQSFWNAPFQPWKFLTSFLISLCRFPQLLSSFIPTHPVRTNVIFCDIERNKLLINVLLLPKETTRRSKQKKSRRTWMRACQPCNITPCIITF